MSRDYTIGAADADTGVAEDLTAPNAGAVVKVPVYTDVMDGPKAFVEFANSMPETDLSSKADLAVSIEAETAAYTLVLTDAGKFVTVDSTSAETVTIPTNASVAFPVGTNVAVVALGTGKVDIQGDVGVTVNSTAGNAPAISAQYAGAQCYKVATDEWLVIGSIA